MILPRVEEHLFLEQVSMAPSTIAEKSSNNT